MEELGFVVANFQAQLTTKINIGDTTASIDRNTDDDGVEIPNGKYFLTIDVDNNRKEHFACTLTRTSTGADLTALKTLNRVDGAETSGALRLHRVGAKVVITDFATITKIARKIKGLEGITPASPMFYTSQPTLNNPNQLATVQYVLDTASGGSLSFDTQIISAQTAGEDGILVNDLVYFKSSDAKWYKVQADVEATYTGVQVGFSKTEADENEAMQVAISGPIENLSGLTPGDVYYASDTPGEISDTPGTAPFVVGYALSATQLLFTVDYLLPSVKEKQAMVGGGDFGTPSSSNKFVTENLLGMRNAVEFTSSGTWTKPAGIKAVIVELYGAGGGGAGGGNSTSGYAVRGNGGGGGAYIKKIFPASELGSTVSVTVGAGGAGGAGAAPGSGGANGGVGSNGGNTSFGTLITAYGGAGAIILNNGGGGGGTMSAGVATAPPNGGSGGVTGIGGDSPTGGNGSAGENGGGGGGGGDNIDVSRNGGSSIYGGGGGGAGGRSASTGGGSGGKNGIYGSGGGGAGGIAPGGNGGNGGYLQGGGGGAGGGQTSGTRGGNGGNGGMGAGGGGGGAGSTQNLGGGNGGNGGDGFVRVIPIY